MLTPEALLTRLLGRPLLADQPRGTQALRGVAVERQRLGARRFATVVYRNSFDIDGLTDELHLLESFDAQGEAEQSARSFADQKLQQYLGGTDEHGRKWQLESQGNAPYVPEAKAGSRLRSLFDRTFKVRAGPYDTEYVCVRVIGPFQGPVVDLPLVDFVNADHELWSHFAEAGEKDRVR